MIDIIQNISNQDYDLADAPVVERNYFYEVPKAIWELVVEILDHFGVIFMISFVVLFLTEGRVSGRKRRSNKFYYGKDKLYPDDKDFINDGSWSQKALTAYHIKNSDEYHNESSSDSSSPWSSDDWSGGGFDAGGSSSDWSGGGFDAGGSSSDW